MKLQMHKNSLFAILLRSPWWISLLVAGGIFAALRLVIPELYASFMALPFAVIGCYAAWQQLREPSAEAVGKKLEGARAMSSSEFTGALEAAFRRDGYDVTRLEKDEADLRLEKGGRVTLVACKRWKVARAGLEPLKLLLAAKHKHEAAGCVFVAAGEVTDNARGFAAENNIRLLHGAELAKLLP
jgi:restriction system protein